MKKLLYSGDIGFDMRDWEWEPIESVYAGDGCIMALTADGRTLQKVLDRKYAARTEYWTRIRQIAISKWCPGLAIGLVSDGSCMIAKSALRGISGRDYNNYPFDEIHDEIKGWRNLVQVEVSDSFFGLDAEGRVHVAGLNRYASDDYRAVESWRNVKRIVTGTQNSILGITADGELLYAGANMIQHDWEKVLQALPPHARIVDVFPTGSECTQVYFALQDGSIWNLWGEQKAVTTARRSEPAKVFDGTYFYNVLTLTDRGELIQSFEGQLTPLFPGAGKIVSFASGHADSLEPFVLAVAEQKS